MLVTGSANAVDQMVERNTDALMKRTAKRPVASGRMSTTEGWTFAVVALVAGAVSSWDIFQPAFCRVAGKLVHLCLHVHATERSTFSFSTGRLLFPEGCPHLIGWAARPG